MGWARTSNGGTGVIERPNFYQRKTSIEKMRGEVFTPPDLADAMARLASRGVDGLVVDPACGDGAFLVSVLRRRLEKMKRMKIAPIVQARRALEGLVGFDVNGTNVERASARLLEEIRRELGVLPPERPSLAQGNFLGSSELLDHPLLQACKAGAPPFDRGVDLFIGNPPYVEAKRLPAVEKERLREAYPDAGKGPVDLFVYFVHAALSRMAPGGSMFFILPNKFLVALYSQALRERLLAEFAITHLVFLSHLPLFEGINVYPIVLGVRRSGKPREVSILRPNSPDEIAARRGPRIAVPHRLFSTTETRSFFFVPSERRTRNLFLKLVRSIQAARLGDALELKWTISFHSQGIRDRFVFSSRPDSPHAMRFLGGHRFAGNTEVQRYRITWGGTWIDYDEERAREMGNQLPPRALFQRTKIVICQNALRMRAAVDRKGFALKDTFILGLPRNNGHPLSRSPEAMVALMNSDLIHFFYSQAFMGGHVGGGYLHFLAPYLRDIPLGEWDDALVAAVEKRVVALETERDAAAFAREDRAVQTAVCGAFGVDHVDCAHALRLAFSS